MKLNKNVVNKIDEFFRANEDIFTSLVEDLDSYNGWLGDCRCYEMYELDEFYHGTDPSEILRRAFYDNDEDTNGEFNSNREYFYFNGYGNLVSTDYKDYSWFIDEDAIEQIYLYVDYANYSDELAGLYEMIENEEEA